MAKRFVVTTKVLRLTDFYKGAVNDTRKAIFLDRSYDLRLVLKQVFGLRTCHLRFRRGAEGL